MKNKLIPLLLVCCLALAALSGCAGESGAAPNTSQNPQTVSGKEEVDFCGEMPKIGPYSQAVRGGELIFLSAQAAFDLATGQVVGEDVTAQTAQIFANVEAALAQLGLSTDDVLRCTVYLRDMEDFAAMNAEYASHFREPYPVRTCVGVRELPLDALLTIEFIVYAPRG